MLMVAAGFDVAGGVSGCAARSDKKASSFCR
ncbi:hypothetical protein OI25_6689 [Paraburkholderia fungorum]|uniref:Uncharacterized protein n=1 Tax=Paraburkholderia fungorum TaxID=134537 RepID=A0AAU8T5V9_9BURK|nr:hypothetical protein OI25_6689 [Paraburkholderia fungorum]